VRQVSIARIHAPLLARQGMRLTVGLAMTSKDVGQLQSGPCHRMGHGAGWCLWTGRFRDFSVSSGLRVWLTTCGDTTVVMCGGVDAAMTQQHLDDADVGAVLQKMRGEAAGAGCEPILSCANRSAAKLRGKRLATEWEFGAGQCARKETANPWAGPARHQMRSTSGKRGESMA